MCLCSLAWSLGESGGMGPRYQLVIHSSLIHSNSHALSISCGS